MTPHEEAAPADERAAPVFGGWRVVESLVVTAAIPGIGWLFDHRDPFFLAGRYPWIVLAPLLVALRHGSALGLANVVTLGLAMVVAWRTQLLPIDVFPAEALVGLFAIAMIAGQFSDLWTRRNAQLRSRGADLERRADALARSHFLLELSHERIDEQFERATSNLRDGIAVVRAMAGPDGRLSLTARADAIMELFATYCGIEVGELFEVEGGALGERCGALGHPEPIAKDDALVARALRSKQLVYVPAARLPERDTTAAASPVLAAVPFVHAGIVSAVLCVQAMPFMSFQRKNLEGMATLAGHFADLAAGAGPETERSAHDLLDARELAARVLEARELAAEAEP